VAPPPLLTPPPNYDDLTPRVEVRDGYFSVDIGSGSTSDDEDEDTEPESSVGRASMSSVESLPQQHDDAIPERHRVQSVDIVDQADEHGLSIPERTSSTYDRNSILERSSVNEEEDDEEEDIVHMVGLEDLSLGMRTGSPRPRTSDRVHGWSF
jgi:hypothetical protein